jgi:hypothetical protein
MLLYELYMQREGLVGDINEMNETMISLEQNFLA